MNPDPSAEKGTAYIYAPVTSKCKPSVSVHYPLFAERARQVRHWTRQADVLFLVNDRADIARLVDADGVHLGQDNLPVREARRILGPNALIGVSTHNLEQLQQAT